LTPVTGKATINSIGKALQIGASTMPEHDHDQPPAPVSCRRCGRDLYPGRGDFYVVSIVALADPSPPVFTEADLALDVGLEIQRLLKQLQTVEAQEAQHQVFRRVVLCLCEVCYREWIANPIGRSSTDQ
jgi:hypothetical protein